MFPVAYTHRCVTLLACLLCFPPVLTALPLVVLCLVFLAAIVAALLLALAFEARSTLGRIERQQRKDAAEVRRGLRTERACVLRDVTHGDRRELEAPED